MFYMSWWCLSSMRCDLLCLLCFTLNTVQFARARYSIVMWIADFDLIDQSTERIIRSLILYLVFALTDCTDTFYLFEKYYSYISLWCVLSTNALHEREKNAWQQMEMEKNTQKKYVQRPRQARSSCKEAAKMCNLQSDTFRCLNMDGNGDENELSTCSPILYIKRAIRRWNGLAHTAKYHRW